MNTEEYKNVYYYNNHERKAYARSAGQSWNGWNADPRYMQNYGRTTRPNSPEFDYQMVNDFVRPNVPQAPPSHPPPNHPPPNHPPPNHPPPNHPPQGNRFALYHGAYQRQFYRNRYQNPYHPYGANPNQPQYGWPRNQGFKRTRPEGIEGDQILKTSNKKKKKPLSQNVPTKKDWTIEEAECALATEKAYNKKSKNSLIIKFPDHELNKDIVSQFHPAIENVHFQQPCTARFCFVTLQESANPDEIISTLNKQKFGEGFLTVEYKKDRDEDQVVLPDDIDPLTLYVGNLAQEVTKEDIVNMYPNNKRIDIGFAKKMKFTRYAFIGFRTAAESLTAFKKTHSKQMYSKSLIVRFRRLHGTIGMPGEAKPQNPPKSRDESLDSPGNPPVTPNTDECVSVEATSDIVEKSVPTSSAIPTSSTVQIKEERTGSLSSDDESCYKSIYHEDFGRGYGWNHQPKVKEETTLDIKKEIKSEGSSENPNVKSEPPDSDDDLDISKLYQDDEPENDNEEEVDVFADMMDFDKIYENMLNHKNKINMLKQSNHIK